MLSVDPAELVEKIISIDRDILIYPAYTIYPAAWVAKTCSIQLKSAILSK